ncbi:nuclear transport factor 2 family protein [Hypericibacter sp.]|uniref:nuclear transport factor 2 family protein n=1 Tax=Hypericibacter sp. TaxID=2705401 RepID=UPI003D6CE376
MTAKEFVIQLFDRWEKGDSGPFSAALAADLVWTAQGTTPISGRYEGKHAYLGNCYKPLLSIFSGPTRCRVKRILGEGDTVVVAWHSETPTVSGVLYAQEYCWVIRIGPDNRDIREVTGYYGTMIVNALFAAHASAGRS